MNLKTELRSRLDAVRQAFATVDPEETAVEIDISPQVFYRFLAADESLRVAWLCLRLPMPPAPNLDPSVAAFGFTALPLEATCGEAIATYSDANKFDATEPVRLRSLDDWRSRLEQLSRIVADWEPTDRETYTPPSIEVLATKSVSEIIQALRNVFAAVRLCSGELAQTVPIKPDEVIQFQQIDAFLRVACERKGIRRDDSEVETEVKPGTKGFTRLRRTKCRSVPIPDYLISEYDLFEIEPGNMTPYGQIGRPRLDSSFVAHIRDWHIRLGEFESLARSYEVDASVQAATHSSSSPANDVVAVTDNTPGAPLRPRNYRGKKGTVDDKATAALIKHHRYADNGCLNEQPISINELAELADVSTSSAKIFIDKQFGGIDAYQMICASQSNLIAAMKLLTGEFSPRNLLGDRDLSGM